jgi:hypothetical protein
MSWRIVNWKRVSDRYAFFWGTEAMRGKIIYWMPDNRETAQDGIQINVSDTDDLSRCAEEAAEHYHSRRDGWEASWPVQIGVANGCSSEIHTVHRETSVSFCSHESVPCSDRITP